MKTPSTILTPAVLLKKLNTLPGGTGLSAKESLQWLRRFDASDKRRVRFEKNTGTPAPQAVIFSPTMRCNYTCIGCYSRNHPTDMELPTDRIDEFFTELETVGTSVCLISGGEPFLHPDLPDLMEKHRDLLFIVFTNGSQISAQLARQLAESGNVIPALSVEGNDETVTLRRGPNACANIRRAIRHFQAADLFFGFSTMVTKETLPQIMDDEFFRRRADLGYKIGFVMEYVPVGKDVDHSLVLSPEERQRLRLRVQKAQKADPILTFQLPDDTEDGVSCGAAGRFLHINSTGGLEPCPFAHHFDTSIRDQSFQAALESPFFKRIRQTPTVFVKSEFSCSLTENDTLLKELLNA